MIQTQILIVGGGPAGATLAKYLSRAHIDNILIQKKFDFKKPCGGGIRMDAFNEFELDASQIIKKIDTIILAFQEKRIAVDISEMPLGIVERCSFDNYLREEAQNAGTKLFEAKLIDLLVGKEDVVSQVRFADGIQEVRSRFVIAADGVNSLLRKKINGDEVSALVTNYADLSSFSAQDCEFHFGSHIASKYYAWAFPEQNGINIGILSQGAIPYMQNFSQHLGIEENYKLQGYKIPEFENPIFYKERVFFVGDSASQVLPFTYEGIYYAMSSAKLLADIFIQNAAPSEYERRWNAKYLKKFTTLKKLQKIFLANDFMISLMMRLYKSKKVQKKMMRLWLQEEELQLNLAFFFKVLKKIF